MNSTPTDSSPREAFGPRRGGRRHRHAHDDNTSLASSRLDVLVAVHDEPPRRGRGRRGDGFAGEGPTGFGAGGYGAGGYGPGGYGGFGPGGPGGRGRGRHGGRGRGPRRGDVRLAVLRLLAVEPMHGYQIITELAERSGGLWRPSPGSVYPTLQALADQGLVTSEESEGRRVFSLTEPGRAEVTRAEEAGTPAPWDAIADSVDERVVTLRSRVGQVMSATKQVAQFGTPAQVDRAGQILADARRALYGLLAEDEPDTTSEPGSADGTDGADEQSPDA